MSTVAKKVPLWQEWISICVVAGPMLAYILSETGIEDAELIALPATWVAQWLVLRRRVPKAGWWLFVSPIAAFLGFLIGGIEASHLQDAIDGVTSSPLGVAPIGPGRSPLGYYLASAVIGAYLGTTLGYAQWLILRLGFHRSGWWVLVSAIGFSAGLPAGYELASAGLATGLVFKWLPKKAHANADPGEPPQTKNRVGLLDGMVRAARFDRTLPEALKNTDYWTTDQAVLCVIGLTFATDIARYTMGEVQPTLIRELLAGLQGTVASFLIQVATTYLIAAGIFRSAGQFGSLVRVIGFARSPLLLLLVGILIPPIAPITFLAALIWTSAASTVGVRGLLGIGTVRATVAVTGGVIAWLVASVAMVRLPF